MAADLGISRRSVSKIENGEQNASLEMAYRIAAYFKGDIYKIFPISKEEKPTSMEECK